MAFWGCVLAPGQKKKVESPEGEILHLSQACLHDPKDGKNFLQAIVEGTGYSIACLEKGKKEHDSFDLFFDPTSCAFENKGKSAMHLTGYFEPDDGMDDEEAAAPAAKVAAKTSPKVAAAASPKVAVSSPKLAQASPKLAQASPKLAAAVAAAKAAEEDSEDELIEEGEESEMLEESEEEAPVAKASPKAAVKTSPKVSPKAAAAEADSDDDEELIEEGEEEEMLEDSEEEEPAPKAPAKRKADAAAAAPPAKAAKGSPAAAPAGSPDQATYVNALMQYLKTNGKTNVGTLGSKVQRPAGAPKMGKIFEQNKDKFVVADGSVSLK